eukprot:29218-Pelagococcus_subviridis.AAC.4
MSDPTWVQVPPLSEYTRTWPAESPAPSFKRAPIATRVPSEDIDTEYPEKSYSASPSIVGVGAFSPLAERRRRAGLVEREFLQAVSHHALRRRVPARVPVVPVVQHVLGRDANRGGGVVRKHVPRVDRVPRALARDVRERRRLRYRKPNHLAPVIRALISKHVLDRGLVNARDVDVTRAGIYDGPTDGVRPRDVNVPGSAAFPQRKRRRAARLHHDAGFARRARARLVVPNRADRVSVRRPRVPVRDHVSGGDAPPFARRGREVSRVHVDANRARLRDRVSRHDNLRHLAIRRVSIRHHPVRLGVVAVHAVQMDVLARRPVTAGDGGAVHVRRRRGDIARVGAVSDILGRAVRGRIGDPVIDRTRLAVGRGALSARVAKQAVASRERAGDGVAEPVRPVRRGRERVVDGAAARRRVVKRRARDRRRAVRRRAVRRRAVRAAAAARREHRARRRAVDVEPQPRRGPVTVAVRQLPGPGRGSRLVRGRGRQVARRVSAQRVIVAIVLRPVRTRDARLVLYALVPAAQHAARGVGAPERVVPRRSRRPERRLAGHALVIFDALVVPAAPASVHVLAHDGARDPRVNLIGRQARVFRSDERGGDDRTAVAGDGDARAPGEHHPRRGVPSRPDDGAVDRIIPHRGPIVARQRVHPRVRDVETRRDCDSRAVVRHRHGRPEIGRGEVGRRDRLGAPIVPRRPPARSSALVVDVHLTGGGARVLRARRADRDAIARPSKRQGIPEPPAACIP